MPPATARKHLAPFLPLTYTAQLSSLQLYRHCFRHAGFGTLLNNSMILRHIALA